MMEQHIDIVTMPTMQNKRVLYKGNDMLLIHKFFRMLGFLVVFGAFVGSAQAAMMSNEEAKRAVAAAIVVAKDAKTPTDEKKESDAAFAALRPCDIDRLGVAVKRGDKDALRKLKHYGYLFSQMPKHNGAKMAFLCCSAAALAGDPQALTNLGICYYSPVYINRDIEQATKLFLQAKKGGDVPAIYMLARCYKAVGDKKGALALFKEAADDYKYPAAQAYLGKCYEIGFLGVKPDEKMAAYYYSLAAGEKDLDGQIGYACCLLNGIGGTVLNAERAMALLQEASKAGSWEAKVYCMYCYQNAIGMDTPTEDAIKKSQQQASVLYSELKQSRISDHAIHRINRHLNKIKLGALLQPCSICYDNFVKDHGVITPCGHRFHEACIGGWFTSHSTCPSCRRDHLTSDDLQKS
jgi:TPR repeat protein